MKTLILFALIALAWCRPDSPYTRFDSIDLDEITGNIRLLKSHAQCILGTGKCTPEAADFKRTLPTFINEECRDCSEFEKIRGAKLIKATREQLPEEWEQISQPYLKDEATQKMLDEFINEYASKTV